MRIVFDAAPLFYAMNHTSKNRTFFHEIVRNMRLLCCCDIERFFCKIKKMSHVVVVFLDMFFFRKLKNII